MKLISSQVQFTIRYGDVRTNIDRALQLSEKALEQGPVDILTFPEMWSTGFASRREILENIDSTPYILKQLSAMAQHFRTIIAGGTLPELKNGKLYNTSYLINRNGEVIGNQQKLHLFPLMGEDTLFSPGEDTGIFNIDGIKIGVAVCFDLRFPEIFLKLRKLGAQIVIIPAQFPSARLQHWATLTKARAIENQFYVIATNSTGVSGAYEFPGNSLVIDPWGEVISNAGENPGTFRTELDLSLIEAVRNQIPMGRDGWC